MVQVETIGQAWLESVRYVLHHGDIYFDEDSELIEVMGLKIDIKTPLLNDPVINKYGDDKVINNMMRKFEKGIVMKNRPFTYGQRIFDYKGID